MEASKQWSNRPPDQRYETLDALQVAVAERRGESWTIASDTRDLRIGSENDSLTVSAYDITQDYERTLEPSNWAFGQLAMYAQAPANYLRKLPAELAAWNLNWGLYKDPIRSKTLVLGQTNGSDKLRAMTSTSYGRIWDSQVVEAVQRVNSDGRWVVPSSSYTAANPKRATTLYASDRDVFVFLVDPDNPIEVDGETLFRGFYTWNSEVGASVFGLTTFLYRYVCDNRIIWGATDVQELRIRHTGGAPERFAYEGARYLRRYADESTSGIADGIRKAKAYELPEADKPGKGWDAWLQARGFTAKQAKAGIDAAQAEEGEARSLWDIINGVTASARAITHTDERVKMETAAGKLMNYAAKMWSPTRSFS